MKIRSSDYRPFLLQGEKISVPRISVTRVSNSSRTVEAVEVMLPILNEPYSKYTAESRRVEWLLSKASSRCNIARSPIQRYDGKHVFASTSIRVIKCRCRSCDFIKLKNSNYRVCQAKPLPLYVKLILFLKLCVSFFRLMQPCVSGY